jgi:hypothetical protein
MFMLLVVLEVDNIFLEVSEHLIIIEAIWHNLLAKGLIILLIYYYFDKTSKLLAHFISLLNLRFIIIVVQ